ncbi:MAG: WD40/YVTN/BNR-like repeat-containing protein, partial [Bacteroidia bacterium]
MKLHFSLRLCAFACNFFYAFAVNAQYKIDVLDSNTFHLGGGVILSKTSFRGLSVVDDKTIWVSGSRGTIAKSVDGGKTFSFQQLKGYEKSDFRDIEAFDDKRAIIMSSGTPAFILKTIDGGQTWKEVYKNTDTAYFLDAMDFWNDKKGMLVGDPVNGHFLLLQTNDGGETWQQLDTSKTPKAFPGEAVFAASGTSLKCWGKNEFGFVTGGKESRFIFSSKR